MVNIEIPPVDVVMVAVAGVATGPVICTPQGSVRAEVIVVEPAFSASVFPEPHELSADCRELCDGDVSVAQVAA